MSEIRTELCDKEYSSYEVAENRATSAGFNLSYAGFGVGASGANSSGSGKVKINQSDFCTASDSTLRSSLQQSNSQTIARHAVAAWKDCILSAAQDGKIYVEHNPSAVGRSIAGMLYQRKGEGNNGSITGLSVIPSSAKNDLRCATGGRPINNSVSIENSHEIKGGAEHFLCEYTGTEDTDIQMAFQTDQGPIDCNYSGGWQNGVASGS